MTIQLQSESIPQTVPLHERTAADWYEEAKMAFDSRDYEKAIGLIHYCIRMDAEKAEHHVLLAKILDTGGGDKKALVKALESAIRINPKDVDSTIRSECTRERRSFGKPLAIWRRIIDISS